MNGPPFVSRGRRRLPANLAGTRGVAAALGMMTAALSSPAYAQSPDLLTAASFGVLAGSTITNTGPTVIFGDIGTFPGLAIVGFPPGTLTGATHAGDAAAQQAQLDNTNAYLDLMGRPTTANLTGQDLGGLLLTPGVYSFNSSAQLTGTLVLNAQGNPNSVFIFNIGSTLTTASASRILLINGASGSNVFWRVGSSATLGTTTTFIGDILALTSITLNTGATITCGAALAQNGAVTLDTNTVSLASLCTNTAGAGTNPQLAGEIGTGATVAGLQAMNSFLSVVTNPFDNNRPFADNNNPVAEARSPEQPQMVVKARGYAAERRPSAAGAAFASVDRAPFLPARRWGIWAAGYGGQSYASGSASAGTHDSSARIYGYATGLDYLVTPYTVVGFSLAGGGTNYSLSDGLGSGHSDMFQAAVYSITRINAAYVSAALAYGWHRVTTDRYVTVGGNDHLTASFNAQSVGGRLEGGYRFAFPGVFDPAGFGVTPYAAIQVQSFRTPSYSETAVSGSSIFALNYSAHTTTATRTELGSWIDKTISTNTNSAFSLFGRAAWAHDWNTDTTLNAAYQSSLPGSSFTVTGATPAKDSALFTAGAKLAMRSGWSVMAKLDTEFSQNAHSYVGTARVGYTW
jgi:uncharacterized protein with beta-barrel porin domain